MKNYRVKAIIEFDDNLERTHHSIGDIFLVTEERLNELRGQNEKRIVAVELIGIDKVENVDNIVEKPKTRKSRKKKEE